MSKIGDLKKQQAYKAIDANFKVEERFSAGQLAKVMGVSVDTARKRLQDLWQAGVIEFDEYEYSSNVTFYHWYLPTWGKSLTEEGQNA